MNQSDDVSIKCPNPEHTNKVKLVCFYESCKEDRLYCLQCLKYGIHVSHPQHQEDVPFLFEHIQRVEKECDDLINRMDIQMDLIYQDFQLLIEGIRSKYQMSKQQLINLNSEQINAYLSQSINFKSFQFTIKNQVDQYTNEFKCQIQKLLSGLQLYFILQLLFILFLSIITQLSYYQISEFYLNKSEELYEKGYKLRILVYYSIIYLNDQQFDEAIKILDQALNLNSKHQLSLWCKADSLN